MRNLRLKVAGIVEIEITDPNMLCGKPRKKLDRVLLSKLKGQDFTTVELKSMFGYGDKTSLQDTQLKPFIELVEENSIKTAKSTRWRIK